MEDPMEMNENAEENETENDASSGGVGNALRMSLRERPRNITRKRNTEKQLRFLNDFDPEKSEREKRKTKRKDTGSKTAAYDEYGHMRHNGADICDCMNPLCPGCWIDCEKCGSKKCGPQCRVNRKFFYESLSYDGKDINNLNPNINTKY